MPYRFSSPLRCFFDLLGLARGMGSVGVLEDRWRAVRVRKPVAWASESCARSTGSIWFALPSEERGAGVAYTAMAEDLGLDLGVCEKSVELQASRIGEVTRTLRGGLEERSVADLLGFGRG